MEAIADSNEKCPLEGAYLPSGECRLCGTKAVGILDIWSGKWKLVHPSDAEKSPRKYGEGWRYVRDV